MISRVVTLLLVLASAVSIGAEENNHYAPRPAAYAVQFRNVSIKRL